MVDDSDEEWGDIDIDVFRDKNGLLHETAAVVGGFSISVCGRMKRRKGPEAIGEQVTCLECVEANPDYEVRRAWCEDLAELAARCDLTDEELRELFDRVIFQ